jgi:hypothetical protein
MCNIYLQVGFSELFVHFVIILIIDGLNMAYLGGSHYLPWALDYFDWLCLQGRDLDVLLVFLDKLSLFEFLSSLYSHDQSWSSHMLIFKKLD